MSRYSRGEREREREKSVSATTLAVHHHLQCDLYLYNSYHGHGHGHGGRSNSILQKKSELTKPTTKPTTTTTRRSRPSELTKASFSRGDRWERALFAWLDERNLLLRVFGGTVLEGNEIREVIEIDEREHFFIAGLSFVPPARAFEGKFRANGTTPVGFGVAKPDLVEIRKKAGDGSVLWRVIDAKSSADVKTSHHVQIYFYHVCLDNMLPQHYKPMRTAAVWIPPSIYGSSSSTLEPSFDDLKSIATPLLSLPLDDFLFNKLPRTLAFRREDVKWHLNPLCAGCAYERGCTERAVRGGELGAMANISIQDAEVLKTFLTVSGKQKNGSLSDIEDLYKTIGSKSKMLDFQTNHTSIFNKAKRILKIQGNKSPVVDAARTKKIQVLNKRIFTLPREEDVAIIITLVLDPATNDIAAYCISTFSNLDASVSPGSLRGTKSETFIADLASIIQYILDLSEVRDVPPRTQCYVFSSGERTALQRTLINAALTSDKLEDEVQDSIRTCIGALCEGAALLATTFQPIVLYGALLGFLAKKGGGITTAELRLCLRRLGLPNRNGTDEELRQRIRDELERLKNAGSVRGSDSDDSENSDGGKSDKRREIGSLPRVVGLKNEIERLLALPIPGYWDLLGCHGILKTSSLTCPSDEEIYSAFAGNQRANLEKMLRDRNSCMYEVLCQARQRVLNNETGRADILVNEARVLTSEFMDICSQDHLCKLFFMQQFEVLAKLNALWKARIEGCIDAPRLDYRYTNRVADNTYLHYFSQSSGYVDFSFDKERTYFGYILTEDVDSDSELPVEALFDDLAVFNLVFPLNKHTRMRWEQQPLAVQQKIFIADVQDIVIRNFRTFVVLRTFGDFGLRLKPRTRYRLSPRLIDFNVTKVLSTLLELDLQTPAHPGYMLKPPFLQLFSDPRAFAKFSSEPDAVAERYWAREVKIQRTFRELSNLGKEAAGSLLLKPSQEHALRRILKYRLSVIWGPPGTGKTYTISLSLLRLIQIKASDTAPCRQIIFLTAMTHAAIEACISKITTLMQNYRSLPGLDTRWLDDVSLERVLSGPTHPAPSDNDKTYIFAGTVYQLYNYCKRTKIKADCVVIDEAGQLGLGPAALVLKSLESNGRVIVAGDNEQLAPILTTDYPQVESRLFGSILDCLMSNTGDEGLTKAVSESGVTTSLTTYDEQGTVSTIVQLTENFRLNPDLGDFVSTIYRRSFKPQKSQNVKVAKQLESLASIEIDDDDTYARARDILVALSAAMRRRSQKILHEPKKRAKGDPGNESVAALDMRSISLALIHLEAVSRTPDQMGYEIHVRAEATFAAALVRLIQEAAPDETIFVATPHRVQRQAVKDALLTRVDDLSEAFGALQIQDEKPVFVKDRVTVDTIERLQGSDASFVICLFSHTYSGNASTAIDFLLERRRLNVAISRAKTLCILVTSKEVLRPSVRVFSNPRSAKGFAFLKAYEERAWSANATVNLDELVAVAGLTQM